MVNTIVRNRHRVSHSPFHKRSIPLYETGVVCRTVPCTNGQYHYTKLASRVAQSFAQTVISIIRNWLRVSHCHVHKGSIPFYETGTACRRDTCSNGQYHYTKLAWRVITQYLAQTVFTIIRNWHRVSHIHWHKRSILLCETGPACRTVPCTIVQYHHTKLAPRATQSLAQTGNTIIRNWHRVSHSHLHKRQYHFTKLAPPVITHAVPCTKGQYLNTKLAPRVALSLAQTVNTIIRKCHRVSHSSLHIRSILLYETSTACYYRMFFTQLGTRKSSYSMNISFVFSFMFHIHHEYYRIMAPWQIFWILQPLYHYGVVV